MSKVIDNRVVSMEFDNSQFEKNVQTSMKTLDSLNKTLDNLPETSGKKMFSGLSKAAGNVDLSGISSGIEAINSKFSALGIAGQEVIRDITRSAIQFGKNAWNMTFGQITSGGKSRAGNIAQSKFTLEGMGFNFQDYYKDIDYAVTGTAYGFDQAAMAASVFASSGVKAGEEMKQALRGISGVAAMTGSSYEEIAYIFEKVNGMGKVTNDSLNMISGRGLNANAALAKALGKTEQQITEMARKGQIDFATFAKAMDDAFGEHSTDADKTLSGVTDNIRAQLSRIGQTFYEPLYENDSALVKMLQSVKAKIKELKAITDPFAESMANVVLDLATHAKKFIDNIDVSKLKPLFDGLAKAVQNLSLGTSLENVLNAVTTLTVKFGPLAKAAKEAFSEVFPKRGSGLSMLLQMTRKFSDFSQKLFITGETADKFKRIFKGAFSIVSLGIKIFKDLLHALSPVTDKFKEFGGKLFDFAAKAGDFFTELNQNYQVGKPFESLTEGVKNLIGMLPGLDQIGNSFWKIGSSLKTFVEYIKTSFNAGGGGLSGVITAAFDGIGLAIDTLCTKLYELTGFEFFKDLGKNIPEALSKARDSLVEFTKEFNILDKIKSIIDKVKTAFSNLWQALAPIRNAIKTVLTPLWQAIKDIGSALSEGLKSPGGFVNLAAMLVIFEHLRLKLLDVKFAFQDFKKFLDFSSGKKPFDFLNNIDKTIGAAKSALFQLTKELKAKAILEIAGAIAILAVSFMFLASIDSDKIAQAGLAMAGLLGAMAGLLKEMDTLGGGGVFQDASKGSMITQMGNALIKLSAAIMVLALAMKQLDGLEHIVDDTLVIVIFMLAFVGVAKSIEVLNIKSFNKVATSMILMSVAIKILASAMQYFDGMQWDNVIQGIVAVIAMMIGIVGVAVAIDKFVKTNVFSKCAFGMILMATAIKLLASAVETLGNMDHDKLVQGMIALGVAMLALVASVVIINELVGQNVFTKCATGMLLMAAAVGVLALALKTVASIEPDRLGAAFGVLLIMMGSLMVITLILQDSLLKAGAGMLLVAIAMGVLAASIYALGSMDLGVMIQGMLGLVGGLIALGFALQFIQGSIGGAAALLIVAVALIPFALALQMLTSLNLLDLAGTIIVLVAALAALTVVCYAMSGALIGAAALLVLSVALIAFGAACAILTALPLADLAGTLLVVLAALVAFSVVGAILSVLSPLLIVFSAAMLVFGAAMALVGGGIALFAIGMETLAVSGVVGATALATIGATLKKYNKDLLAGAAAAIALGGALIVLDAGLVIAAVSIAACAAALSLMAAAMLLFAGAATIFSASLILVSSSLKVAIQNISDMLSKGKFKEMSGNAMDGIKEGFRDGIDKVKEAIAEVGKAALDKIKSFFGGGADSEMGKAGANAVNGFVAGIKSKLSSVGQAAKSLGTSLLSKLKSSLKIKSPSRETMEIGELTDEGLAIGIKKGEKGVKNAAEGVADTTVDAMSSALSTINNAMSSDVQPTITPIMDLSEIQNGVNSMNGLIDSDRAANISANFSAGKMAELEQIAYNQAQIASLGFRIDQLSNALLNQPAPEVNANVILQGDADGIFKVVRNKDSIYTKMHGKSAFA